MTMLQIFQFNDFQTHCNNMLMLFDSQWARYNMLRCAAPRELPRFLDALRIQSSDEASIKNLLDSTPQFMLNELFNMFEHHDRSLGNIYKWINTKLTSEDVNTKHLAERCARYDMLDHLHYVRDRIMYEIIGYHKNGITVDESYNHKGALKESWRYLQPKYQFDKAKVYKALWDLASHRT